MQGFFLFRFEIQTVVLNQEIVPMEITRFKEMYETETIGVCNTTAFGVVIYMMYYIIPIVSIYC